MCDLEQVTSSPFTDTSGEVISEDVSNSRFYFLTLPEFLDCESVGGREGRDVKEERNLFQVASCFQDMGHPST